MRNSFFIKASFILITSLLISTTKTNAQWDCRSQLGAYISPLYKGAPLSWAAELSMAPGKLNNHVVSNGILMLGLNYQITLQHQFYFEGAFKNYNKIKEDSLTGELTPISNNGFGFREFFYKYQGDNANITAGIQTSTLGDFFLVDERILGAAYNQDFGKITINARLGTVQKDFARMGDFCGTRKLLYMVKGSKAGDRLGETNLFGTVLTWNFNREVIESNENDELNDDEFSDNTLKEDETTSNEFASDDFADDEFADDEFSDSEFSEFSNQKKFIDNAGLVFYSEFGTLYNSEKYFIGGLAKFNLPLSFILETELIGQVDYGNNAVIYYIKAHRNFNWQNFGNTGLEFAYIGYMSIDADAIPNPSFSNMYMGEILRLDTRDVPVFYTYVKHHFPWEFLPYFKFGFIKQIYANKFTEFDFELRFKLFKHLQISPMFSIMKSDVLNEKFSMLRVEFRLTI